MHFKFQPLRSLFRENNQLKFKFPTQPTNSLSQNPTPTKFGFHFLERIQTSRFVHSVADSDKLSESPQNPNNQIAITLQNLLKNHRDSPNEDIQKALNQCELTLTDDLVISVLQRHRSDWKPAYIFFNWVSRQGNYSPGHVIYSEILDILGKMHRFEELTQVFDGMSKREGLVNDDTFGILVNRYAAAHKIDEAVDLFYKRKEFGFELDLAAFQKLLMGLCRYKHVEVAETLFHSKKNEFGFDIKTWNIVLNGWCVLGNVGEAKRFWKDIVASKCKPDLFTYGTFVNALTKKGKLGTALKLFRAMWEKGCNPDVVICNCVIDALCFKKRIPEALEVFREMNERGCLPNVVTYNSLIKHLCKIGRMEKVYELLHDMEQKKGSCLPNDVTYNYLLKSLKKLEEVPGVLERMKRNGCKMTCDTYNLILKLYMDWDCEERVRCTWDEMEKNGLGPDRRSYTIMIHGLHDKERIEDALCYFHEMTSKGMVPEPRTELLVNAMNTTLKEREGEQGQKGAKNNDKSLGSTNKKKKEMKAR